MCPPFHNETALTGEGLFLSPPRALCAHASAPSHKLRVDRAFAGFNGGGERARREGNGRVCWDQISCVLGFFFSPAIKTTHDQPWEINWGPANKTLIYGLTRLRLNKLKAAAIYFKEVSEWRSPHLKSNLFTAASDGGENKYPSDLYFFFFLYPRCSGWLADVKHLVLR